MKIKICGLKRIEDVNYVNQYQPDWAGFVFAGEKRKIDFDTAQQLKQHLDSSIKAVGVFVNADIPYIEKLVKNHVIDIIQLHGDEDTDYVNQLRVLLNDDDKSGTEQVPVIKAVRVKDAKQVLEAQQLPVDYLLLDAFKEDEYGGSGKVFDHNLIPNLTKPYLLAGGIHSDNVTNIIDSLKARGIKLPFCVDVSSSVETDGYKDEKKIRDIVHVVRAYNDTY